MVVLKKIKGSTLMETLVATVLIIVIFMLASMILNNLFSGTVKNNTRQIEAHLNELHYLYYNEKLELPYSDDYKNWNISIELLKGENTIAFYAKNSQTNKTLERIIREND